MSASGNTVNTHSFDRLSTLGNGIFKRLLSGFVDFVVWPTFAFETGALVAAGLLMCAVAQNTRGATHTSYASQVGTVARSGENGTSAVSYSDVNVGFYDGVSGNQLRRGYAFFGIPDEVKNGIVNSVSVGATWSKDGLWNSVYANLNCYTLGQATYTGFVALSDNYTRWVALGGHTLQDSNFDNGVSFAYPSELQGRSEIGVSFVPSPAYIDDKLISDETYTITLTNIRLVINYTPADTSPDDFNFTDLVGRTPNTSYVSDTITISGINKPTSISVSQPGYYRIDSGEWTTSSGTISNGQTVQLKRQSSSNYGASVSCILFVGDKQDSWYITTVQQTCSVSFDKNGGDVEGSAPATQSGTIGSAITLPTRGNLSRYGYSLGGWNTTAGGTGTTYGEGASYTISGNVTLYAKWNENPTYLVSFWPNGADGGNTPSSISARGETFINVPGQNSLYRNGFTFVGWNTQADGAGTLYPSGAAYLVQRHSGLYAKWTQDTVNYTVSPSSPVGRVLDS